MPAIHLLPDHLISQIAAGEVVERPASVVKELVENALDAGSSEIVVELESGGKRGIRVIDDGSGMGEDDALLAFDRHATSKIRDFEDLQSVATLGFRGEALASIAAVAKVELATAERAGQGWKVQVDGGRVLSVQPVARARGTTIEVRSLFYNVPARRKFLKQPATELRRCVEVVQAYCLACPDVGLTLRHEGRALVEAPATTADAEGLRSRIRQLFGSTLSDELVELSVGGLGEERIAGFVGSPVTSRGRRLFVFVNGRLLRDRQVLATFYRTVRDEWRHGDFPSLFLFLGVPPEDLDVNVHPQKAEVRFRDGSFLDRVRRVLQEGLLDARGEGAAPLATMEGETPRLAWQGLGAPVSPSGVVGETVTPWSSDDGASAQAKIAETAYTSAPVSSVPLSGPRGDQRTVHIVGQYKGALLLLEGPDGLLLVDQHAAHERVLYEKLRRAMVAEDPAVQRLLVPRLIELGPAERLRLAELAGALRPLGFWLEEISGHDLALTGVPAVLADDEALDLLVALATGMEGRPDDPGTVREAILGAVAADSACRGAIKIHHPLSAREREELVATLFSCEDPWACPHGRPTILKMTDAELERRFGRR